MHVSTGGSRCHSVPDRVKALGQDTMGCASDTLDLLGRPDVRKYSKAWPLHEPKTMTESNTWDFAALYLQFLEMEEKASQGEPWLPQLQGQMRLFQVWPSLRITQRLFFLKHSSDSRQPPTWPVPHTWHWKMRKCLPGQKSACLWSYLASCITASQCQLTQLS